MDWQFGDDEVIVELPGTKSDSRPAPRAILSNQRRIWMLIFLTALAASCMTDFYLGRVQQTTAALEAQIQGRLDVESWAWQQGDWGLFRSLLPRRTPSRRLKALEAGFKTTAPEKRDMKLAHYVVGDYGTRVEATVQVTVADRQYEIERTYRLMDGRWQLVRLGEFDGNTAHP